MGIRTLDEISYLNFSSYLRTRARDSSYDEVWNRIAENLMLDELLCGEASPVSFLKEQIILACDEIKLEDLGRQASRIRSQHE